MKGMLVFENTEIAFKDRDNKSLKKAYWLFKMVGSPFLVKAGALLLKLALFLRLPVEWLLKPTVFNHFCGGETIDDCDETIHRLGKYGIMTILDYSAEGKEEEAEFEYTRRQIMDTIDKAAREKRIPYAVFKPTGLAGFYLLEKVQSGQPLSDREEEALAKARSRFECICAHGADRNVPVMIDSEESWIQDVVDGVVEDLMASYNKDRPMIYNTLQMYRHDRLSYLERSVVQSRQKRFFPAFKLVRGAYLEKERRRAGKMGYQSPVYSTRALTDKAFDEAVAILLSQIEDAAVCVATHNEISCVKAADIIHTHSIPKNHPHISFAQLLGMSDHISYNLSSAGYNVCKYVPYGPVKTVIPYLIRRAEENTSVAGQTSRELFLIKKEIGRRRG